MSIMSNIEGLGGLLFFLLHISHPSLSDNMQVNTEQSNTQRMLEHNQKKDRVFAGSLQRKLVDVVTDGGKLNIDPRESIILNVFGSAGVDELFTKPDCAVESSVDAQLLIKLKFIDKVDCCQISFFPPSATLGDENREVSNGRTVKIFVNRNEVDFTDLDSLPVGLALELPFEFEEGKPFTANLAGSKFTRLSSMQIFLEDNYGTEFSRLGRICLGGFLTPTYEYK